MKPHVGPRAVMIVGCATALGSVACGGGSPSSPTNSNSNAPPATPTPIIELQNALLNTNDFQNGAVALSPTAVPDLTSVKCSPPQASGTQYQYKSEIQAASGRVYGNLLVGFDNANNAHAFVTQFYTAAQSCCDASGPPVQDTFGTYSFYFSISASPSNLDVEVLQLAKYVSVIIQYLPSGGASNVQSVRDLTNESLTKLKSVNA